MRMNKPPRKWVSLCGRYAVTISNPCLSELLSIATEHSPNEVGSSLFGTYSKNGFCASVLGSAPLTSDSIGGRLMLLRGVHGLKRFFLDIFKHSQGKKHYVGEWHSHPGGLVAPSRIDDRNQNAIARNRKTNCPECILVIVGGNFTSYVSLGVYVYSRKSGRIDLVPEK